MKATKGPTATFWGVRGSVPIPQADFLGCGGNTACVQVSLPDGNILILDGGTGARALGCCLMEQADGAPLALSWFLTHFHSDHIQGIPFFSPLYAPSSEITFYSLLQAHQSRQTLRRMISDPYFPVDLSSCAAKISFEDIRNRTVAVGDALINSFPLCHPQGACGYRIQYGKSVLVFASDREHGNPELDEILRAEAQGADILIYDSQFTTEEYDTHRGWGHSTWLEATRVARESKVGKLILFHHDPSHSDRRMDEILDEARKFFPNTDLAKEGVTLSL